MGWFARGSVALPYPTQCDAEVSAGRVQHQLHAQGSSAVAAHHRGDEGTGRATEAPGQDAQGEREDLQPVEHLSTAVSVVARLSSAEEPATLPRIVEAQNQHAVAVVAHFDVLVPVSTPP